MAHISIEYSANLESDHDIGVLVDDVHEAALGTGAIPLVGLRTRAHRCDFVRIANGDDDLAFVAVTIRLGPGRDDDVKIQLIRTVLDAAEAALDGGPFHVAYSCEAQEIDAVMRENRNHIRAYLEGE